MSKTLKLVRLFVGGGSLSIAAGAGSAGREAERAAADRARNGLWRFREFTWHKVLRGVLTKKFGFVLQREEDWRRPALRTNCRA